MSLAGLDTSGMESVEERDSLGGRILEGGASVFKIEAAYTQKAKSGALMFYTMLVNGDGQKLTDTQCVASGDTKGNKPYYEKDGKKIPLPGYSHVEFMSDLILGKKLSELQSQEATIKLWNKDQGKEVPTKVTAYPELHGKKVMVGVKKIRDNKMTGPRYDIPTAEERVYNEVDKYFDAETGKTKTELRGGSDAEFLSKWRDKYEGKLVDNYTEVKGGAQSGATGSSPFGSDSGSPSSSLFDED